MVDIYLVRDYEHLKKVNKDLRSLDEYLGDVVTVKFMYIGSSFDGVVYETSGHLMVVWPFDYIGIAKTSKSYKSRLYESYYKKNYKFNFVGKNQIIIDIVDMSGNVIFENKEAQKSIDTNPNVFKSSRAVIYYRRKLFGNIIADIDEQYRSLFNGNVFYPKGINGLGFYESEIQKLDSVKNGEYPFNFTMTDDDADIVNVPIYRWDDNNEVGVWRGQVARVKSK